VKGEVSAIAALFLTLIVIASISSLFIYITNLRTSAESSGESQLIELDIPPKVISFVCYEGYAYMYLSLSQGQGSMSGQAYYKVELDTGEKMAEGFVNATIEDTGYVYIPYLFNTSERYQIQISGRNWAVSEYCRPVNDPDLLVYLPLDEGTGTSAEDQGYYGNDGGINGGTWVTGQTGYGVMFRGTSPDQINLSLSSNQSEFTVFSWVKRAGNISYSNGPVGLVCWRSGNECIKGMVLGSGDVLYFSDFNATPANVSSGIALSLGVFYQVASVYGDGYASVYVNGTLLANTSFSLGSNSSSEVQAGGLVGTVNKLFNGTIDEIRIYSRALKSAEVYALYSAYQNGR
jgi:hypothetical protein